MGRNLKMSPGYVETRSGFWRPVVLWDHKKRVARFPDASLPYEQLRVMPATPPDNRPLRMLIRAIVPMGSSLLPHCVQVDMGDGSGWKVLYTGRRAIALFDDLVANGVPTPKAGPTTQSYSAQGGYRSGHDDFSSKTRRFGI